MVRNRRAEQKTNFEWVHGVDCGRFGHKGSCWRAGLLHLPGGDEPLSAIHVHV